MDRSDVCLVLVVLQEKVQLVVVLVLSLLDSLLGFLPVLLLCLN